MQINYVNLSSVYFYDIFVFSWSDGELISDLQVMNWWWMLCIRTENISSINTWRQGQCRTCEVTYQFTVTSAKNEYIVKTDN